MANTKVLQLASLLGAVSEGFAPQIYPNLAKLGQAGRQMAGQALVAEEQKKQKEAAEKKEKGGTWGAIGSAVGSTLGTFVGGPIGGVVGGTLGGAAGEAAGGGSVEPGNLLKYGVQGGLNGLGAQSAIDVGSTARLAEAGTKTAATTAPAVAAPLGANASVGMAAVPPNVAAGATTGASSAVPAAVPGAAEAAAGPWASASAPPPPSFKQNMQDWYRGGGAQMLMGPTGSFLQKFYDPQTPVFVPTKFQNGRLGL